MHAIIYKDYSGNHSEGHKVTNLGSAGEITLETAILSLLGDHVQAIELNFEGTTIIISHDKPEWLNNNTLQAEGTVSRIIHDTQKD